MIVFNEAVNHCLRASYFTVQHKPINSLTTYHPTTNTVILFLQKKTDLCDPLPSRRRSQRNRQLNQIPHSLGRSFVLTTALAKGRPLSSCISFHQRAAARCLSHSMLKKRDLNNYKVSKYILARYHLVQCTMIPLSTRMLR